MRGAFSPPDRAVMKKRKAPAPASTATLPSSLLNVLHLLPQLLHLRLDDERRLLDRQVGGLGEHRVGLAVQLLQQEVEPLADLAGAVDAGAELLHVAAQPHQL